jgi:hypothetical protein
MKSIFIVGTDDKFTELSRTDYDSEDLFQQLLGDHPVLWRLAGGKEGRLLLVRREQPVLDQENGFSRWSLDHLFPDRQFRISPIGYTMACSFFTCVSALAW